MIQKKYALLDADFVIKSIISKNEQDKHLIDLLFEDEEYQYICHQLLLEEISKHDNCGAVSSIKQAISDKKIKVYSDREILQELENFISGCSIGYYMDYLRKSCDSMSASFYSNYYSSLDNNVNSVTIGEFLLLLEECDKKVGSQNSLGERKAMILFQTMSFLNPGKVYVFCSDDRKARIGFYSITAIQCKSIMSIFWDYYKKGIPKDDMEGYFLPLKDFLTKGGRVTHNIRVYEKNGNELKAIACETVFDDIYENKFVSLKNGFLKYKS